MKRTWLAVYLANWYAFAVAGVLLSLQRPGGSWLATLPWTAWGTEIGMALAGQEPASGGAGWILMGAALTRAGVAASVVASLMWLAANDSARTPGLQRPAAGAPEAAREAAFTDSAREAASLVEDPRLRSLIQQLNTRLG